MYKFSVQIAGKYSSVDEFGNRQTVDEILEEIQQDVEELFYDLDCLDVEVSVQVS